MQYLARVIKAEIKARVIKTGEIKAEIQTSESCASF